MKKKTTLERFEEIKDLEVADEQGKTVKDILPYFCENVESALKRLEAIDNTNPSEALKCLEQWYGFLIADNDTLFSNGNVNYIEHQNRMGKIYDEYTTIKQALIKAQEPKHYLKWEDLEFKHTPKIIDVKMSGNKYTLNVGCNVHFDKLAILKNGKINYYFLEADKQFFNDLHLERVEE